MRSGSHSTMNVTPLCFDNAETLARSKRSDGASGRYISSLEPSLLRVTTASPRQDQGILSSILIYYNGCIRYEDDQGSGLPCTLAPCASITFITSDSNSYLAKTLPEAAVGLPTANTMALYEKRRQERHRTYRSLRILLRVCRNSSMVRHYDV